MPVEELAVWEATDVDADAVVAFDETVDDGPVALLDWTATLVAVVCPVEFVDCPVEFVVFPVELVWLAAPPLAPPWPFEYSSRPSMLAQAGATNKSPIKVDSERIGCT